MLRYQYGNQTTSTLAAEVGDHQGSTYAEVAMTDGMPVRVRKQDPFGNERGAAASGTGPQSRAAFLGVSPDDASGYTQLGARMYDPAVGRFLSADPVLDIADPMQANGYTYAHNNPVTLSDPTGLAVSLTASETAAALAACGAEPGADRAGQVRLRPLSVLGGPVGRLVDVEGLHRDQRRDGLLRR